MYKILVVDDDPTIIHLVKHTLETAGGFEVMTVNNASQAMASARQFQPDLMLLDVMMPEMLGTEIASKMAEASDLKNIKLVFITSMRKKNEELVQGVLVGGHHIIAKPLYPEELLNVVRKVLVPE